MLTIWAYGFDNVFGFGRYEFRRQGNIRYGHVLKTPCAMASGAGDVDVLDVVVVVVGVTDTIFVASRPIVDGVKESMLGKECECTEEC